VWPQRLLRGDDWRRTIGSDNDLLDSVSEVARLAKTESLESFLEERRLPAHVQSIFLDYIAYDDAVHGGGDILLVRPHVAKSPGRHNNLSVRPLCFPEPGDMARLALNPSVVRRDPGT